MDTCKEISVLYIVLQDAVEFWVWISTGFGFMEHPIIKLYTVYHTTIT